MEPAIKQRTVSNNLHWPLILQELHVRKGMSLHCFKTSFEPPAQTQDGGVVVNNHLTLPEQWMFSTLLFE
jgi:hypothetical protein